MVRRLSQVAGFGCGAILVTGLLCAVMAKPLVLVMLHTVADVLFTPEFTITAEYPRPTHTGRKITLRLNLHNGGSTPIRRVLYADLHGELAEAIQPVAAAPSWLYVFHDEAHHRHKLS